MVFSRETAAKNAEKKTTNVPGTCQLVTRNYYGAPSAGDRDHDGDADAVDGWKSETKQHPGDRKPPRGTPVAFGGGSKGFGHRAISLGGIIRSTDMFDGHYAAGRVGNATIEQIERSMGVRYLGWSETITGIKIPTGSDVVKPATPAIQLVSFVIDVSHHQFDAGFTLAMAWKQGYRHTILKCTQGVGYVDPQYKNALTEAQKLGFKVSIYHFLEQGNGAKQADNLIMHILDKELPVWIDWEPTREGTKDASLPKLADMIAFRDRAKDIGLRVVGKYLGSSYWERVGKPNIAGPLDLWRPAYPSTKNGYASKLYPGNNHERWNSFGGQKPSLWQFTDNGKINGFSKGVDVNAYRGSHDDLDKEGWFKDYSIKSTPTSAPKPTPAPKPEVTTVDFHVHLVPSNSHAKNVVADVKSELALVAKVAGGSAVVFNTELESKALRDSAKAGLGKGFSWVFENEVTMAYGSNWKPNGDSASVLLAKDDPSMVGVSPSRKLNELPLQNGVPVTFLGTHWVSEANCIHKNVKGRAWREKTWKIQLNDTLLEIERLVSLGQAVVLAGDFNTGVYFTSKQLFAELQKRFGSATAMVYGGSLDAIYLISSPQVKLSEVGTEVKTNNASDHDAVNAKIKATKV